MDRGSLGCCFPANCPRSLTIYFAVRYELGEEALEETHSVFFLIAGLAFKHVRHQRRVGEVERLHDDGE